MLVASQITVETTNTPPKPPSHAFTSWPLRALRAGGGAATAGAGAGCAGEMPGRSSSRPFRSPYVLAAYVFCRRSSYSPRSRRPSSSACFNLSATACRSLSAARISSRPMWSRMPAAALRWAGRSGPVPSQPDRRALRPAVHDRRVGGGADEGQADAAAEPGGPVPPAAVVGDREGQGLPVDLGGHRDRALLAVRVRVLGGVGHRLLRGDEHVVGAGVGYAVAPGPPLEPLTQPGDAPEIGRHLLVKHGPPLSPPRGVKHTYLAVYGPPSRGVHRELRRLGIGPGGEG